MWEEYRRFKTTFFLVSMIATPFALIGIFLGWEWVAVLYALLVIGGYVYPAIKLKCPYCGYPLERIARSHENCCPDCGMEIPETEDDIDWSYFTGDEA